MAQSTTTYAGRGCAGLVGPQLAVLVRAEPDSELVQALWPGVLEGNLSSLLMVLAGRVASLPDFALAHSRDGGVVVFARGAVRAQVHGGSKAPDLVSGDTVTTWREAWFEAADRVVLSTATDTGDAGLPILGGVVAASRIDFPLTDVPMAASAATPMSMPGPVSMPAPISMPAPVSMPAIEPLGVSIPEPAPTPQAAPALPAFEPISLAPLGQPEPQAQPFESFTSFEPLTSFESLSEKVETPAPQPLLGSPHTQTWLEPAAEAPQEVVNFDPPTEMLARTAKTPENSADNSPATVPDKVPDNPPPTPPRPSPVQNGPAPLLDRLSWLDESAPHVAAPVAAPLGQIQVESRYGDTAEVRKAVTDGELFGAIRCPQLHLNPPATPVCRECFVPLDPNQPPILVVQPKVGRLRRLDTGEHWPLMKATTIIGRTPGKARGLDQLPVMVTGVTAAVSDVHTEVLLHGWRVEVMDRSERGTFVINPGDQPLRLEPRMPMRLLENGRIVLADEVTFVFEVQ